MLEKGPAVINERRDPRVLEGAVGIQLDADRMDPRVDFHGVDVPGAEPQRDRDIVTGPGADDEDVVGRGAHARVWDAIDGYDVELPAGGLDRLVGDAVHQQRDRP